MNDDLKSAAETVGQLEELALLIRDVREEGRCLDQEERLRKSRGRAEREEALEQMQERGRAELVAIEKRYEKVQAERVARTEARAAWLERAAGAARRSLRDEIRSAEGQATYDRQKTLLQARRRRDEGLRAATERYEGWDAELEGAAGKLRGLSGRSAQLLRGYAGLARSVRRAARGGERSDRVTRTEAGVEASLEGIRADLASAEGEVRELSRLGAVTFFRTMPLSLWLMLILAGHAGAWFFLREPGMLPGGDGRWMAVSGVGLALIAVLAHAVGGNRARGLARELGTRFTRISEGLSDARAAFEAEKRLSLESVETDYQDAVGDLEARYSDGLSIARDLEASKPEVLEERIRVARERHGVLAEAKVRRLREERELAMEASRRTTEAALAAIEGGNGDEEAIAQDREQRRSAMRQAWDERLPVILHDLETAKRAAEAVFPPWEEGWVEMWEPPAAFVHGTPFCDLKVDMEALSGGLPEDPAFPFPGPLEWTLPLLLKQSTGGSLILETSESGRKVAAEALNQVMLRLLATMPPGRLAFTILDPVGLGESFSGVMHLADYEENLITRRIWTQPEQIDQRLAELNEHIEKVIQMYLRDEFASIVDYNREAGNIAERYRFLVVADFPNGFTETSAQKLLSVLASGPKCGVYALLHRDCRQRLPPNVKEEDLHQAGVVVSIRDGSAELVPPLAGSNVQLQPAPPRQVASRLVRLAGEASIDSTRVEVPFAQIAPEATQYWTLDATEELRVPIGRSGASKLQYLALGKGTRQHALVAGKTGSGKSTLFHVLITNLSLWYSPDEVEMYLIDFKKGVEFKVYGTHRLPHARVVAVESDREFGLSVLQRLDGELRERGERFRKAGAQDLAGYRRAEGGGSMPRVLLLVDEFQEFFVDDDRIAQGAALLLDRLVRQGRAFGIHVILGSQTLGGAFTVHRATLGQMVVRIALQCSEADSYLILDESNPAARLLTRPGEGIYNDSAGAVEGNSPFQVVWLPEEERAGRLEEIRQRADHLEKTHAGPMVFEGNAPADVAENRVLAKLLESRQPLSSGPLRLFLGAPNAIKGPTEVALARQSGNHLLIVGQQEEAVLAMLAANLVASRAQAGNDVDWLVLDGTLPDSPERKLLESAVSVESGGVRVVRPGDAEAAIVELAPRLESAEGGRTTVLWIQGLQRFKKLKSEDEFSFSLSGDEPSASGAQVLADLIQDGAAAGVHVVACIDSYNNVTRFLSRKLTSEFDFRVLFQMSATDSSSLIDSPAAGGLGLHRALLHNEAEGHQEVFRPYAFPREAWLREASEIESVSSKAGS